MAALVLGQAGKCTFYPANYGILLPHSLFVPKCLCPLSLCPAVTCVLYTCDRQLHTQGTGQTSRKHKKINGLITLQNCQIERAASSGGRVGVLRVLLFSQ